MLSKNACREQESAIAVRKQNGNFLNSVYFSIYSSYFMFKVNFSEEKCNFGKKKVGNNEGLLS